MAERPRRRRKAARPEEILQAAIAELAEKGLSRATLGSIAARAGISRTTIYLYFGTKEEIFEAIARATVERTIDEAAAVLGRFDGPFPELFETFMTTVYDRLASGEARVLLRVLVAEGQAHPELVAFYHREILSKGTATVQRLLALGVTRGELAPEAADLDPRLIVAPTLFAAIWGMVFDPVARLDVEAFRRDHVRVMLRGLMARA